MTLLTSGNRAVLRQIQDYADRLSPGLLYFQRRVQRRELEAYADRLSPGLLYFPSVTVRSAHP